ncbi:hypothetical protein OUZ56_031689 [Daphnia magna]|uniref:Uncharacterized protein n=1 Tax=Daphnia magna TaxID=35525 RepID=A0ABQ9ZV13_9CRUS|nr:hypothetical protein OUZ56_031689 [Daphnia magna]
MNLILTQSSCREKKKKLFRFESRGKCSTYRRVWSPSTKIGFLLFIDEESFKKDDVKSIKSVQTHIYTHLTGVFKMKTRDAISFENRCMCVCVDSPPPRGQQDILIFIWFFFHPLVFRHSLILAVF